MRVYSGIRKSSGDMQSVVVAVHCNAQISCNQMHSYLLSRRAYLTCSRIVLGTLPALANVYLLLQLIFMDLLVYYIQTYKYISHIIYVLCIHDYCKYNIIFDYLNIFIY